MRDPEKEYSDMLERLKQIYKQKSEPLEPDSMAINFFGEILQVIKFQSFAM